MKAAIFYGEGKINVEDRPRPETNSEEVLVKIKAAGICGSDVLRYKSTPKLSPGVMFGHEYSGQIVDVGRNVRNFSVGDRVGLEPLIGCGKCGYCLSGNYHLCTELWHIPAFVEYQKFPQSKLFKLPDTVSYEEAAILDCVAVAVHALKLSGLKGGETVAVLGAGTIGLLTMQTAKAFGSGTIYETGTYDFQTSLAQELGADITINVRKESLLEKMKELTGSHVIWGEEFPYGVDHVFESVGGLQSPLEEAVKIVRSGGTVTVIGSPKTPVNIGSFVMREIRIIGSSSYAFYNMKPEFRVALDLLTSGKVNTKRIITHVFPLEKIQEAFEVASDKKHNSVKVVIRP